MARDKPPIPDDMLAKWQRVVDILASIVDVPAGLIMKAVPPKHHVFISSATEGNPYTTDTTFELNTGLYCDTVMEDRRLLIVPNALEDPEWNQNPDLEHGMVFYMGFPLVWPDGTIFGTICVLDRQNNEKAVQYVDLLSEFKGVVDSDLKLLVELAERRRMEKELQEAHDGLERRVRERTRELMKANEDLRQEIANRKKVEKALRKRESELEETNTALKVLLQGIEEAKQEAEERILWNIDEQIMPYLDKLKRRTVGEKSRTYLALLESNLKNITAGFPNRLSSTFSTLTPTEIEVVKLIMQGQTTKEIAGLMSIATSTIDFHRNNIRKKVGINRSNVNLRTYLSSLS
jgi:DNA-binding CsgD family transcriptional regulator